MHKCWRVLLQLCKVLLARLLFGRRLELYTHGFWGLEDHFIAGRGRLLLERLAPPVDVLLHDSRLLPGRTTLGNWNRAGIAPDERAHDRHELVVEGFSRALRRNLTSELEPEGRRLLVVPFARHQLDAVDRWIRWNLPLACFPADVVPASARTVVAFYISTTWDAAASGRLLETLSRVGASAWGSCLEPDVYFIEAQLDARADRYARSTWVSERDSAGTGNMFYPLLFAASAALDDESRRTVPLEPFLETYRRSLKIRRASMSASFSMNVSSWRVEPSKLPGARYLFWCEPDCNAVRARFDVALRRITQLADERRLWVLGSPLRSANQDARISWRMQYHEAADRTHLNGNAIYRVGDLDFCRWLWRVWRRHGAAAFDVAMDRQLHSGTDGFWERANILSRFAQTDWIHNMGNEPYEWRTIRRHHKSCFFVHGKYVLNTSAV